VPPVTGHNRLPDNWVENLRNTAKAGEAEPELTLFRDFNGLEDDFDKKVDFSSHDAGSHGRRRAI